MNKTLILKLPDYNKDKNNFINVENEPEKNLILGEIIAVPDISTFKIGQKIVFGQYAHEIFRFEGENYYFLAEEDVRAIQN